MEGLTVLENCGSLHDMFNNIHGLVWYVIILGIIFIITTTFSVTNFIKARKHIKEKNNIKSILPLMLGGLLCILSVVLITHISWFMYNVTGSRGEAKVMKVKVTDNINMNEFRARYRFTQESYDEYIIIERK